MLLPRGLWGRTSSGRRRRHVDVDARLLIKGELLGLIIDLTVTVEDQAAHFLGASVLDPLGEFLQ
ncbi:hypothetical protein [Pseudomonas sp. NFACC24-1]|uniref:hypothetical protein n=1 Tax=Pseudomonas sp. NFACC24-1 TaxID=1566189 RepID=UPI0011142DE3|nr:hypothetical protein [Pseudomonas sp. NFACC24-1]